MIGFAWSKYLNDSTFFVLKSRTKLLVRLFSIFISWKLASRSLIKATFNSFNFGKLSWFIGSTFILPTKKLALKKSKKQKNASQITWSFMPIGTVVAQISAVDPQKACRRLALLEDFVDYWNEVSGHGFSPQNTYTGYLGGRNPFFL